MKSKIKYICNAVKWLDKINGNTYHSVRITRTKDNKVIAGKFRHGYEDAYKFTALRVMLENNWLPKKYNANNL